MRRLRLIVVAAILAGLLPLNAQHSVRREDAVMSSMSIVGFDPATGELGIAMASRFFAVAPIATHVRAGVAAVATMGGAPYKDGEEMLDWLEQGATPEQVLARLRERYADIGQINIVDAHGRSTATTGAASEWKGHRVGTNYAAAGNILAGPQVVAAFGETFEQTEGKGLPLAERLMRSLEAADAAGGDARGRMGATLRVSRRAAGPFGTDVLLDVRVDDSPHAIDEVRDLYERWKAERAQQYGSRMIQQTQGGDVQQLQRWLRDLGYIKPDDRAVFDEKGQPRGVFNDATVAAVVAFKTRHQLGAGPSANREVILEMIEIFEDRARGRGTPSAFHRRHRDRRCLRASSLEGTTMSDHLDTSRQPTPKLANASRRRMLQALAGVGITGPLALELAAQSRARISADTLRRAAAVLGEEFSAERLAVIEKALQRNLDQFQIVRDLAIDDRVEPAPIFTARNVVTRASAPARNRR